MPRPGRQRRLDPRAVALGAAVTGAVVAVVALLPVRPGVGGLLGAVAGGGAAGLVSRTHGREFVDGAIGVYLGGIVVVAAAESVVIALGSNPFPVAVPQPALFGVAVAVGAGLVTIPVGMLSALVAASSS